MIIAFSGFGGSGKTTQIQKLNESFVKSNLPVVQVALREYYLWPRVVQKVRSFFKIKEKDKSPKVEHKKQLARPSRWYVFVRDMFYFFDTWRIWFFVVIPSHYRGKTVLLDRSPLDFMPELAMAGSSRSVLYIMARFLPRPNLHIWFKVSWQEAYRRKPEESREFTKDFAQVYYDFFKKFSSQMVTVDANLPPAEIASDLETLARAVVKTKGRFDVIGWMLHSRYLSGTDHKDIDSIQIDPIVLMNYSARNRCALLVFKTWPWSEDFRNLTDKKEVGSYITSQQKSLGILKAKMQKYAPETSMWIKEDAFDAELSSDVDIIFWSKTSYKRTLDELQQIASKSYIQNEGKADIYLQEGVVDLHHQLYFAGAPYLLVPTGTPTDQAISIIGHALAELGEINLGDMYKLSKISYDEDLLLRAVKQAGWAQSAQVYLRLLKGVANRGYTFPIPLPVWLLIYKDLNLFFRHKSFRRLFSCLLTTVRAYRARQINQIPFHPSWWFRFFPKDHDAKPGSYISQK